MIRKIFTSSIILLAAVFCFGQSAADLPLVNKEPVLNGRAFFNFPAGARNVARQGNIMSADPNGDQETRIILDIGKQRMVFFARELFVTGDGDLVKKMAAANGSKYTGKLLTENDSMSAVLSAPTSYDSTKDAILISSLMVRSPDHSLFSVDVYINPEGFKDRVSFQALAEKIFATIVKGTRRLDFSARDEVLPIFEGKKKFTVKLPEGYVVSKDKKYVFEVFRFQNVRNISDTNWASLVIYVGDHPSYFYGEYDFESENAVVMEGQFAGQKVEWFYFNHPGKQFYLKEQKIPMNNISTGTVVHIAMLASQPETITTLTTIAEQIKLTE